MSTEAPDRFQRAAATKRKRTINSIAEAAKELFDERGWHEVTRDDIAKAAGVGVATLHKNLGSKQNVALVAYASLVRPLVTEGAVTDREVEKVITDFIHDLANAATDHPVLAIALLPACRDTKSDITKPRAAEVDLVNFDQLAEHFGRLLEVFWNRRVNPVGNVTEIAELYLSGLLSWTLKHPDSSARAATILINQL
ncbi:TetR/AcrR family transcriptional regulator [Streptomyces sp. NBC_00988]|uniref:TetR/AcrR family transcriptional regulator n=1 Tax=Streptomyces sp. NBC_00988 TaxID=2903704 RepID=UPI00386EF5CA|nr:TetR/AcrR family transcriptional regulator [Streptomyces sp. NBC_00988]